MERDPRFHHLLEERRRDRGFHISGFHFPGLPVLTTGSPRRAVTAGWGMIPPWARDYEKARSIRGKTLNARAETVAEKPSFKASWPKRRCLVPVEGFFEPHRTDGGTIPWYITRKDRGLFFLGGIYQSTPRGLDQFPVLTCSLLTVPARDLLAEIHNEKLRMPLMIASAVQEEWLSPDLADPDPLNPRWLADQEELEAWPVDRELFRSGADLPQVRKKSMHWIQKSLF